MVSLPTNCMPFSSLGRITNFPMEKLPVFSVLHNMTGSSSVGSRPPGAQNALSDALRIHSTGQGKMDGDFVVEYKKKKKRKKKEASLLKTKKMQSQICWIFKSKAN